jgi:hypothetical protein
MEFDGPVSTPRINSGLLNSYVNMHVRIVGRVAGQQQLDVTLEASDGGSVLVKRNPATASVYSSHAFVEVLGTVQPDLSISEIAATGFGAQFGRLGRPLSSYKSANLPPTQQICRITTSW